MADPTKTSQDQFNKVEQDRRSNETGQRARTDPNISGQTQPSPAPSQRSMDAEAQAKARQPAPGTTRAEQPLPVDIFPKDGPTEITIEKLWGGGEHRKAAQKALDDGKELSKLLKAFPEDTALINETIQGLRIA